MPKSRKKSKYRHVVIKNKKYYFYSITWVDITAHQAPLTPSEINQYLNWPKQTVHRLCKSMVEEGFLLYDVSGKRLLPSANLRTIANGLLASDWHTSAMHQILEKLSHKVKETVNFVIPEHEGMIYRDRVQTNWAFQIHLPVGTHVPFLLHR